MSLNDQLAAELDAMDEAGTRKTLPVLRSPQGPIIEIEGRGEVICLCSNDYLGLANHPDVVAAAAEGLARYGAGTASVRFICGKFQPHVELERDLAEFCGTPAALTYVSCWNANAALLDALCDRPAAIFSDRLNHASIIDGMRLARPAHKAVYEHSDPDDLRRVLAEAPAAERRLIVTDGVFSMEGDLAPLPELAEIAASHDATLIVDDSHGIGVVGETGRGVLERFGLLGREDIVSRARSARPWRGGGRLRRRLAGALRRARATLPRAALLQWAAAVGRLRVPRGARRCCATDPGSSRRCGRTRRPCARRSPPRG